MIDPLRRALIGAAVICTLCATPGAAQDSATFSIPQARALANQALLSGNPQLAVEIARGLLHADPKDPDTLLIISAAQAQLGNNQPGFKAARLAYRHAQDPQRKLDAATLAVRHSVQDKRLTLSQIWLRRAALHASGEASQQRIAQEYAAVRAANPWRFRLDTGLRPSDNVNNGSDTTQLTVNGVSTGGALLGSAQALSGVVGSVNIAVGYRLRGDARRRTELGARVFVQRVALSGDARAKLREAQAAGQPAQNARDFASTYVETSLRHSFAIGTRKGDSAAFTAAIGQSWYGGKRQNTSLRGEAQRVWALDARTEFLLSGTASGAHGHNRLADNSRVGLRTAVSRKRQNGDQISLSFGLRHADSDFDNGRFDSATLRLGYGFKKQWGPARIRTSLTVSAAEYPDFITARFEPTGAVVNGVPVVAQVTNVTPRDDRSAHVSLTMFFPDFDYAGFAPEVTLRAGKRGSNVSRFESSQLSVTVGIQSKF